MRWPAPRPRWWLFDLLILATVALGMVVVFHMEDRQVRAERAARLRAEQINQQQAELGRRATCVLINAQIAAFTESPPRNDTGKSAAQAWHDLGVLFRCTVN